jgi:hypothetical protein
LLSFTVELGRVCVSLPATKKVKVKTTSELNNTIVNPPLTGVHCASCVRVFSYYPLRKMRKKNWKLIKKKDLYLASSNLPS